MSWENLDQLDLRLVKWSPVNRVQGLVPSIYTTYSSVYEAVLTFNIVSLTICGRILDLRFFKSPRT